MPTTYRRISGADLAEGLAAARVSPKQFAVLYGVADKRVDRWLDGSAEVPHAVALFVGMIADPEILERALVLARHMMEPRAEAETVQAGEAD